MLQQHGGALSWRARLSPLVADADERFDEIQIYGFGDAEQRKLWATDPRRQTLQTLQRRLFRRDVLVFVDARVDADAQPSGPPDVSGAAAAEPVAGARGCGRARQGELSLFSSMVLRDRGATPNPQDLTKGVRGRQCR